MKTLTGYIVASSMEVKMDTITLSSPKVYFNIADAREMKGTNEFIFKINIRHPQDGEGNESQSPSDILFDEFYAQYPRKVGRPNALKAWKKFNVDAELFGKIIDSLNKHKAMKQWQDKEYVPHPATWLNQERWNDEVTSSIAVPTNSKYAGL